ncbi:MAG TPA: ABC transporter substrate-binding protein [Candidatus Limnocylindria bacterium]|nr:ABC transporter substrate-binding protein [Candidatus Limnocylindria bacterium]
MRKLPIPAALGAVFMAVWLGACTAATTTSPGPSQPAGSDPPPSGEESPGEPSGEPIVVGSTLSLSGIFAATGAIHQIAGEQFVERLNDNGGLLGRPVEWMVLDDESDQAQVGTLYERLISQEQVDLIIGPYATPNILAAMAVAQRHGYVLPQHTAVLAPFMNYECQFPGWSIGPTPNEYVPNMLFDALESLPEPPETIAIVTNQNGSTDFISRGLADDETDAGALTIAPERGLDLVLELPYPPGTSEWGPIAAEIRDADPDVVMNQGLGVDPVGMIEAMQQLDYEPPIMFSLFPAPGPPLGLGDAAQGMLSVSIFEGTEAALEEAGDEVREIVETFEANSEEAGLPYTTFETQAAASWHAWEILAQGVEGAGDVDNEAICSYLQENGADLTFSGQVQFDPEVNNFWDSNQGLKQIQGDEWVMVWPEDVATAELQGPGS